MTRSRQNITYKITVCIVLIALVFIPMTNPRLYAAEGAAAGAPESETVVTTPEGAGVAAPSDQPEQPLSTPTKTKKMPPAAAGSAGPGAAAGLSGLQIAGIVASGLSLVGLVAIALGSGDSGGGNGTTSDH